MFPDPSCPECGEELPDRGYRVCAVPRLGGQIRKVCASCAEAIDGQARLDVLADTRRQRSHERDGSGRAAA